MAQRSPTAPESMACRLGRVHVGTAADARLHARPRLNGEAMKQCAQRIASTLAIVCAGHSAQSATAQAQSYPTRAIHLVVGNPPGGATDFIARAINQPHKTHHKQNILIDN